MGPQRARNPFRIATLNGYRGNDSNVQRPKSKIGVYIRAHFGCDLKIVQFLGLPLTSELRVVQ